MDQPNNTSIKLVEFPAVDILSIREKMTPRDLPVYVGQLCQIISQGDMVCAGAPMAIFRQEVYSHEKCDMEVAIPVKQAQTGACHFAPGLCAMGTLHGSHANLASLYTEIKEWVYKQGYTPDSFYFVAYLTDPAQTPEDKSKANIYLPVKR